MKAKLEDLYVIAMTCNMQLSNKGEQIQPMMSAGWWLLFLQFFTKPVHGIDLLELVVLKEKNCTAADLTYVTVSECNVVFWGTCIPVLHKEEPPKNMIDGTWAASAVGI